MSSAHQYRIRITSIAALLFYMNFAGAASGQPTDASRWLDAWSAAPDSAGDPVKPQTLRQVVRLSADGKALRIRLSNQFGTAPLTIGAAHVALHDTGPAIVTGSDRAITFGGKPSVTIPKGGSVLSDPVAMSVSVKQELSISLYLPKSVKAPTIHTLTMQTGFATLSKDVTAATVSDGTALDSLFFLTDVEVQDSSAPGLLVAIGDSITDGVGATIDANNRWPDLVTDRLIAAKKQASDPAPVAIVNTGVIGNRLLNNGLGTRIVARFDQDALNKAGVTKIILEAGINDVGETKPNVSVQQIIQCMQKLIARAHANHIQIGAATLLPFRDSKFLDYTEVAEKKRLAVNQWIRSSGAFDSVFDFDAAMRDPAHPERLMEKYDSGDHTHPNPAGYQVLANLIDLNWLERN